MEEDRMADATNEAPVLAHIQRLVDEEHRLYQQPSLADEQSRRLKDVKVELDQCWDLLRQRRAARETRHHPAHAHQRPPENLEK
jgi:hypothetical protein